MPAKPPPAPRNATYLRWVTHTPEPAPPPQPPVCPRCGETRLIEVDEHGTAFCNVCAWTWQP